MSTQRTERESHSLRNSTRSDAIAAPPYTICMSARVHAEARRLFQALVVPEYLEMWLRIPDESAACRLIPMEPAHGFVLESAGASPVRIFVSYTPWRRRRLSISWRVERNRLVRESMVTLRLIGDFEFTVLSICHTGLMSAEELMWHRRLWTESLERLKGLFQGVRLSRGPNR